MTSQHAFAETVKPNYGEPDRCPACGQSLTLKRWIPPYQVRLRPGKKDSQPADFITGAGFEEFLASRKFVEEWRKASLSGVESWHPVDIVDRSDISYFKPDLPHPTVRADLSKMHAEFEGEPSSCTVCARAPLKSFRGIVIDEKSWRRQDLFRPTNVSQLIGSSRLYDRQDRMRFSGLKLVPAETFVPSFTSS